MNVSFPTIQSASVSQVFGNYNPGLYGGDRKHKGIDFGVMAGTPVYACMDGSVVYAATVQTGYGRSVRILHPDGALSIYGHLTKLLVSVGDVVKAGQEIGKSGGDKNDGIDGDGLSTGAHLHWEIRPPGKHVSDQTAVDPMEYCLQYIPAVLQVGETTGGINVRTLPSASAGRIGGLFRKEIIYIAEVQNQWGRIHSLRPEWVTMAYVRLTGERVTINTPAEVQPPAEIPEAEKLARLWKAHPELHG